MFFQFLCYWVPCVYEVISIFSEILVLFFDSFKPITWRVSLSLSDHLIVFFLNYLLNIIYVFVNNLNNFFPQFGQSSLLENSPIVLVARHLLVQHYINTLALSFLLEHLVLKFLKDFILIRVFLLKTFNKIAVKLKGTKCPVKQCEVYYLLFLVALQVVKHHITSLLQIKDTLSIEIHLNALCLLYCEDSQSMELIGDFQKHSFKNDLEKWSFFP